MFSELCKHRDYSNVTLPRLDIRVFQDQVLAKIVESEIFLSISLTSGLSQPSIILSMLNQQLISFLKKFKLNERYISKLYIDFTLFSSSKLNSLVIQFIASGFNYLYRAPGNLISSLLILLSLLIILLALFILLPSSA